MILYEDDDYIIVRESLYQDDDYHRDWQYKDGTLRFSDTFNTKFHYALYEVNFILQIDKKTGNYVILQVSEGDNILDITAGGLD